MTKLAATVRAQKVASQIVDALDDRAQLIALDPGPMEQVDELYPDQRIEALLIEFNREWREAKQ